MTRRQQRLNVLFREELSELIRSEVRDPRLAALVSITKVDVSPDLEHATVYVSILSDEEEKAASMTALRSAAPYLRRHLLSRIRIRRIPALQFVLDHSIEDAAHVLELMKKVADKDRPA